MKITFLGAAGEVTGSAYLVQTKRASVLIDAGMFQGGKKQEAKNRPLPQRRIARLDAVLLTHAHLDHTGRLPLLAQHGYRGPIFATEATLELARLVLEDSARIQIFDTERVNRRNERSGAPPITPLYTPDDAAMTLELGRPLAYHERVEVAPGMTARWVDAGHLLGSASIELTVEENGARRTVVFSGDLGPKAKPLLRDAETFSRADMVVMESTYGDRDHKRLADSNREAVALIQRTVERGGKVIIPAFALGRTQELLYALAGAFHDGRLPTFPVYIDSPMAGKATEIYRRHPELFDEEARALVESGQLRYDLSHVTAVSDSSESRALNEMAGPFMVIAGSGMCTGGRILHHLRHNLWRPETAVIFVGFQGQGSLGRRLVDGARQVKIFGEPVSVKAQIATINGLSGHAGQKDLLGWFDAMAASRPRVILTHGEDRGRGALAALLRERYGLEAALPTYNETMSI